MDIANIVIAFLALVVAVIAIVISVKQAKKSDKIALMGLRIDFYNNLCGMIRKYKICADFKMMLTAKNSHLVFPQGQNSNLAEIVLSNIGDGNVVKGFQKITNDLNFLDINKYLFDEEIISKIDEIINLMNELQKNASGCLTNKNIEAELQKSSEELRDILKKAEIDLMEKIKTVISPQKKSR